MSFTGYQLYEKTFKTEVGSVTRLNVRFEKKTLPYIGDIKNDDTDATRVNVPCYTINTRDSKGDDQSIILTRAEMNVVKTALDLLG